jgi:hypothetical protein
MVFIRLEVKVRGVRVSRSAESYLWQRFVIFGIYFEMHHLGIDAPQLAAFMLSPAQTNLTNRLRADHTNPPSAGFFTPIENDR